MRSILFSLAIIALSITAPVFGQDPPVPEPDPVTPAVDPIPVPIPVPTPDPQPPRPFIPITFPSIVSPNPQPIPQVTPADPAAIPKVAYGQIYVIQSDAAFVLRASPKNLVDINHVPNPNSSLIVRGVFADGNGKVETRTLTAKFVAFVDAKEGASGRVELTAIPYGFTDAANIVDQLIDIGAGPRPPPTPDPAPTPEPPTPDPNPPTPAPTGFRVIIVYDAARLTREQYNIIYSSKIANYLNSHCIKATIQTPDGPKVVPEWRAWKPNPEIMPSESRTIVDMWNSIDHEKISSKIPVVVIAVNGQAVTHQITTTDTEDSVLAKLKKAGGE